MQYIQSSEILKHTQDHLRKLKLTEKSCTLLFFLNQNYSIVSTHTYLKNIGKPLLISEIFIPGFYVHASYVTLVKYSPNRKRIKPTKEEIEFYKKLKKTEKSFGIFLQDFLIISKNNYFSFYENRIISHV